MFRRAKLIKFYMPYFAHEGKMKYKVAALLVMGALSLVSDASSDTVYLKDQEVLKGIVVEEYKDRIVLSTANGEQLIMRKDTEMVVYDEMENNLVNLGEQYRQKGDLQRALYYFKKAYGINPDSKAAKDGVSFVSGNMFRKDQDRKAEVVRRREIVESWRAIEPEAVPQPQQLESSADVLRGKIGIEIEPANGNFVISGVLNDSPADQAGMKKGDLIVAVWGRLTGYLSTEEVIDLMSGPKYRELRVTVQRQIQIRKNEINFFSSVDSLIDAKLDMKIDGLTVVQVKQGGIAGAAGLEDNDLIVSIDNESTRYMPLKKAVALIKDQNRQAVTFLVRKEMVLWK